mgnify:CR=1 FL=1
MPWSLVFLHEIFTLLFLMFSTTIMYAQNTGSIVGKLIDKELNDDPLPFANVLIKGTTIGTTSDFDGLYDFENLSQEDAHQLIEAKIQKEANRYIHQWPEDKLAVEKAEVTLGGVDTKELSSKTFESKKQPGLYFIGEVVDVTGHLGGHNFQWAWSSGFAAGQDV